MSIGKKILNHILTIILILAVAFFILTFAIAVPIYCRPLYYGSIKWFDILSYTDKSYTEVVDAFNKLMDYLCWHKEFSLGTFTYSQDGYEHFQDCRFLFDLNIIVCICTGIYILVIYILDKKHIINLVHYGHFSPFFYGSILTVLIPVSLIIPCLIDFDSTFIFLHEILFPGKTNYYFNIYKDPIVTVLPEEYFGLCCGVIGFVIVAFVATFISLSAVKFHKYKKALKENNLTSESEENKIDSSSN